MRRFDVVYGVLPASVSSLFHGRIFKTESQNNNMLQIDRD